MFDPDAVCHTSLGLKSSSTTTKWARMAAHCCVIGRKSHHQQHALSTDRNLIPLSRQQLTGRAGVKLGQHNLPCITSSPEAEVKITWLCVGLREREPRWQPLGRLPALWSANVALEHNHHPFARLLFPGVVVWFKGLQIHFVYTRW